MSKYLRYSVLFLILFIVQACQTTKFITDKSYNEKFRKISKNPSSVLAKIPDYTDNLHDISGKTRIQISLPHHYQRGFISFISNRQQSKFKFKNSLGIEGGELYFNKDSVLVYNRIDKFARKMSIQRYSYIYLNGVLPINPINIISPRLDTLKAQNLYQSSDYYAINFHDGTRIIISKKDYLIRKIEYPAGLHSDYTTVMFSGYATIDGFHLPRKIQILSSDKKSNIFLLIQSLKINPSNPDFKIKLPPHLKVEHL